MSTAIDRKNTAVNGLPVSADAPSELLGVSDEQVAATIAEALLRSAILLDEHRANDLNRFEILALRFVRGQEQVPIVGDITRALGVLPAQTSRILRQLESAKAVGTKINHTDKRKNDVIVLAGGQEILDEENNLVLAALVASGMESHEMREFAENLLKVVDTLRKLFGAST